MTYASNVTLSIDDLTSIALVIKNMEKSGSTKNLAALKKIYFNAQNQLKSLHDSLPDDAKTVHGDDLAIIENWDYIYDVPLVSH
jgi:hypothetical protein